VFRVSNEQELCCLLLERVGKKREKTIQKE